MPIVQQLPENWFWESWRLRQRWSRAEWTRGVGVVVSVILLTSAFLKAHELASGALPPGDLFQNRWLILTVVEWEFVLAAWLLSNVARRAAWLALTVTFTGFLGVTLFRALNGERSCGCFGQVEVSPWFTLCLDATILALLLVLRPRWAAGVRGPWRAKRAVVAGLCAVIAGSVAAVGCVRNDAPAGVPESADAGQQGLVVLNPDQWVGKPFPLSSDVTLDQPLTQGSWIAVLYHHNCDHCRLLLTKLGEQVRQHPPGAADPLLAAIEMPPYGQSGGVTAIVAGISAMHQGRLSAAHDWFVDTPVVVALRDGQVLFAKQQADFADIAKAKAALGAGGRQSSAAGMGLGSSRLFWNCNAAPETDDSWFDHVQAGPDVPVVRITGGRGDFSFGDVRSGSVHAVVFEVTNGGTAPLKVTGVRSECPCLKARPDTMVVAPGGTGRLLVGYKAPSDVGPYQGRLLLTVDGGAPMLLTVRATVQPQPSGAYVCSKGAAVTAF